MKAKQEHTEAIFID